MRSMHLKEKKKKKLFLNLFRSLYGITNYYSKILKANYCYIIYLKTKTEIVFVAATEHPFQLILTKLKFV